jgi:hypothetical protein
MPGFAGIGPRNPFSRGCFVVVQTYLTPMPFSEHFADHFADHFAASAARSGGGIPGGVEAVFADDGRTRN